VLEGVDGAVPDGRLVEGGHMPERDVRGPDRQRDERVREDAEPHHAREREHRPEKRPRQPGEQAERREVAESDLDALTVK